MREDDLRRQLFSPASVALVGASDDITKTAARPLSYLRANGFRGTIYPVSRRNETVQGERAWPSITSLPEVPDHAYILTPTAAVMDVLKECAHAGVPVATVLANGFAESGPEGVALQEGLLQVARDGGTRIVGPNSLGVVDFRSGLVLTANAAFQESGLPVGGTLALSHSGSMLGALVSRGKTRGVGFAGLVSVGSEADLSIGEIAMCTLDDERIDSYVLFLESLRHASALRSFALEAQRYGKPVVAYHVGRSAVGGELALSHTGALASDADVAAAFLADSGIACVDHLDSLLEGIALARTLPTTAGTARVGVVTTTGGGAAMVVDQLSLRGIDVVRPSEATFDALQGRGLDVGRARIVDLTLAGTSYEKMKAALQVIGGSGEFDLVIAVVGSSARLNPATVQPVVDLFTAGASLAAYVVPDAPEATRLLSEAGVPAFNTPECCADAVGALLHRRTARGAANGAYGGSPEPDELRTLDEIEAYALLADVGIETTAYHEIPVDGGGTELPFDYPVVVKAVSTALPHKSDIGAVVRAVDGRDSLERAVRRLRDVISKNLPPASTCRLVAEPMHDGIGEVLVGYRHHPQAGPIVMVAAGGELTEIYRDRSIRLAPVDVDTAREMISEVRALEPLKGFRSRPPADLEALASVIVAISRFADRPDVAEMEINPLLVRSPGSGAVAVDALARVR